jgi:hypothetical protein
MAPFTHGHDCPPQQMELVNAVTAVGKATLYVWSSLPSAEAGEASCNMTVASWRRVTRSAAGMRAIIAEELSWGTALAARQQEKRRRWQ